MTSEFCKKLPKIELHAHLNGSLSVATIAKLVRLHMKNYPDETVPAASQIFCDPKNFDDGYAIFKCAQALVDHPEAVKLATNCVLLEFAQENVKYIELRSTPRAVPGKMTKLDYLTKIVEAINETSDITAKLLVSIDRRKSVEEANENLNLALEVHKGNPNAIVGIDLSGDARVNDLKDYVQVLRRAQNHGMKIALHLAEVDNNEEIEYILNHPNFKPDRVGHCTFIHPKTGGCESTWTKFCQWNVPTEICLTSNIKCKSVESYSEHHLSSFYNESLPLCICTDDKGAFSCSSSEEHSRAMELLKITEDDMFALSLKAIDYIFADEHTKNSLRSLFVS